MSPRMLARIATSALGGPTEHTAAVMGLVALLGASGCGLLNGNPRMFRVQESFGELNATPQRTGDPDAVMPVAVPIAAPWSAPVLHEEERERLDRRAELLAVRGELRAISEALKAQATAPQKSALANAKNRLKAAEARCQELCPKISATLTVNEMVANPTRLQEPITRLEELIATVEAQASRLSGRFIAKGDPFSVRLDMAWLKDLPDAMNSSEALIIFQFTEPGAEGEPFVSIIGPRKRVPDETFSPEFSRTLYGPKRLEGDALKLEVFVYEQDTEEREGRVGLFEFIGKLNETFKLANPVAASEIELARTIAQILNSLDSNDPVLEVTFDFVPDTDVRHRSRALSLQVGSYGFVKQEVMPPVADYFFFTDRFYHGPRGGRVLWLLSVPIDLVLFPLQGVIRATNDVPNNATLRPLKMTKGGSFTDDDYPLCWHWKARALFKATAKASAKDEHEKVRQACNDSFEAYTDKTWLTLSIDKGGDASTWEVRRQLNRTQEELKRIVDSIGSQTGDKSAQTQSAVTEALDTLRKNLGAVQPDVKLPGEGTDGSGGN